jgi:hypothetical protein
MWRSQWDRVKRERRGALRRSRQAKGVGVEEV